MPSCYLLSFLAPLMGILFWDVVFAAPTPVNMTWYRDSRNVSHPYTTVSDSDIPFPSDYASTVLFHHNMHRANHSASPLTYSSTLAAYATSLSQSCNSLSGTSVPAVNASYSTNTYAYYTSNREDSSHESEQTARAISTWYNEELDTYIADSAAMMTEPTDYTNGILHFSQVVWKDTTEVGCAATKCEEGTALNPEDIWPVSWAVVCAYSSAGNCVGNACPDNGFLGNVGAPLGMNHLGHEPYSS